MSNPKIEALQEALKALGYDPGRIDGLNGPRTRTAASQFAAGDPPKPLENLNVDPNGKLNGVRTSLAKIVLAAGKTSPAPFEVLEGLRTRERQAQLVKSGASKTMNSKHLTGDAVDLWPLDENGKRLPSDAAFPKGSKEAREADRALWAALRIIAQAMKEAARAEGVKLTWGGDWKSFPDGPHFQLD